MVCLILEIAVLLKDSHHLPAFYIVIKVINFDHNLFIISSIFDFRRCALKDGFEKLLNSLPNLYGYGTKPTNAVVLSWAAQRIRRLKTQIVINEEKTKQLEQSIQRLNNKISYVSC